MKYGWSLFLALFLVSCSSERGELEQAWMHDNGKLKVLSTVAMIDDLVSEIGGDEVDTLSLIQGELDPHSYELVKGDEEKFQFADLIFYNGLGLEHGYSLRAQLEGNPKAVVISEGIDEARLLVVDGERDPHIWMDISIWLETIEPITEALCALDPEHASLFKERASHLKEALALSDKKAYKALQALPASQRYLVTSHDAFGYFTRRYLAEKEEENWGVRCKAPEGLAPDAELSIHDLLRVVQHIQTYQVKVLFPESNLSPRALRKLVSACQEKGLELRLCEAPLYGDSMGEATCYKEMMEHNVSVIKEELAR